LLSLPVPVVQKVDGAIHRINLYPLDSAIGFRNTYPLDSAGYPAFEQLGPACSKISVGKRAREKKQASTLSLSLFRIRFLKLLIGQILVCKDFYSIIGAAT